MLTRCWPKRIVQILANAALLAVADFSDLPFHQFARSHVCINNDTALDPAMFINQRTSGGRQPNPIGRIGFAQKDFRAVNDSPRMARTSGCSLVG